MAVREGTGSIQLSSGATSTGPSTWHAIRGSYAQWALQVRYTTGSTAITVLLQGALSTASTSPTTLATFTQASNSGTIVQSTLTPTVVTYIRSSVTALSTSTGAGADSAITSILAAGA